MSETFLAKMSAADDGVGLLIGQMFNEEF